MIAIRARNGFNVFVIIHMSGESVEIVENVRTESAVVSIVWMEHFLMISFIEHREKGLIATFKHFIQFRMHPLNMQ